MNFFDMLGGIFEQIHLSMMLLAHVDTKVNEIDLSIECGKVACLRKNDYIVASARILKLGLLWRGFRRLALIEEFVLS